MKTEHTLILVVICIVIYLLYVDKKEGMRGTKNFISGAKPAGIILGIGLAIGLIAPSIFYAHDKYKKKLDTKSNVVQEIEKYY